MLTYRKNDAFALLVINVLLEYVQNKRLGSKGLTLVFLGYDEKYSKFGKSLRMFLENFNQGNFFNFRDGHWLFIYERWTVYFY